jgi:hypothetical protein
MAKNIFSNNKKFRTDIFPGEKQIVFISKNG